ncbi:MAG TPA: Uma2 family endonuclease [Myxococcota bacterium]|jgi:hypothetical protein|nr:Uma2 family endonuclease [Myxococcota bacterium]
MGEAVRRPATYEDLLAVPDELLAQIVDGELVASPRPAMGHAIASSALGMLLGGPFGLGGGGGGGGDAPGGWWIVDEPELHLGVDILVPDLAGWRRARMPAPPDAPYVTLAPDWVCEGLSPSTAGLDRVRKPPLYARAGVAHAWLVDPAGRTLEVLRRHESRWLVADAFAGDARVRAEPFDAVELHLAPLWLPPG